MGSRPDDVRDCTSPSRPDTREAAGAMRPPLLHTLFAAHLDAEHVRVQGENVPRAPTSSKTEIFLLIFFALLAILGIISSFY
jgi:hypothetical protein